MAATAVNIVNVANSNSMDSRQQPGTGNGISDIHVFTAFTVIT